MDTFLGMLNCRGCTARDLFHLLPSILHMVTALFSVFRAHPRYSRRKHNAHHSQSQHSGGSEASAATAAATHAELVHPGISAPGVPLARTPPPHHQQPYKKS